MEPPFKVPNDVVIGVEGGKGNSSAMSISADKDDLAETKEACSEAILNRSRTSSSEVSRAATRDLNARSFSAFPIDDVEEDAACIANDGRGN